jgi:hypothetical protein
MIYGGNPTYEDQNAKTLLAADPKKVNKRAGPERISKPRNPNNSESLVQVTTPNVQANVIKVQPAPAKATV